MTAQHTVGSQGTVTIVTERLCFRGVARLWHIGEGDDARFPRISTEVKREPRISPASFGTCCPPFEDGCVPCFVLVEFENRNRMASVDDTDTVQTWRDVLEEKDRVIQALLQQLRDATSAHQESGGPHISRCGGLEKLLVSFCVDPSARQARSALKVSVARALEEAESIAREESRLMERRAALVKTVAAIQRCQQALLKSTMHPVSSTTPHPVTL